jgi:hypothetical protein
MRFKAKFYVETPGALAWNFVKTCNTDLSVRPPKRGAEPCVPSHVMPGNLVGLRSMRGKLKVRLTVLPWGDGLV